MNKIIIYDSDHYGAVRNECFKGEYASKGPGHGFTVHLARKAIAKGFEVMTSDVFLSKTFQDNFIAFCITEMVSSNTNKVIQKGAIPFLCLCMESPIIARDFYIGIERFAGRFLHSLQFKGTADRLSRTSTEFAIMYYPMDSRIPLPTTRWSDRKLLVLINRNKRIFFSQYSSIKNVVRSLLSPIKVLIQKAIDPWVRSKEIYKDRIEAIYHFSKDTDFHLYGGGWENKIPGFSLRYHKAALSVYRGSLDPSEKLPTMNKFKFAICFENCVFPGYVTEKIFDCFLAQCIPIYYGAPDIDDFVPALTFIDYRKFKDFAALEHYINNLSEEEATRMLESAKQFVLGHDFDKFYSENVAGGIIKKIEHYLEVNTKA